MAPLSLRRLRDNPHIRALTRAVRLDPEQFIQPLFVVEGLAEREPVPGLRDVWRDTPVSLLRQVEADLTRGVNKFLLFGVPGTKREGIAPRGAPTGGTGTLERDFDVAFTAARIADLKGRFGADLWLGVDVCLCSHTAHGHCGILDDTRSHVLNDATVTALAGAALAFAQAGADCVAPSDMMDGRVRAIREALDGAGLERTVLMSYAAKFHSAHYGPFRLAADSTPRGAGDPASGIAPALKDRASYQIDPARPDDALLSALRDADEGADMLMVKPGLPCLDVLARLSAAIPRPFAVYQTSGEQAGLDLVAGEGLADPARAQLETWTAFARAGATAIISYAARRAPEYLL